MIDEEVIEVLYNNCYGGWDISEKAIELYKLRNVNYDSIKLELYEFCRTDPILIQIYHELGDEINTYCSYIKIEKIQKKYEQYYYITECEGVECVKIDYSKYKFDTIYNKIKEILQSTNTNNTKINEIEKFISTFDNV